MKNTSRKENNKYYKIYNSNEIKKERCIKIIVNKGRK